MGIVTKRYTFWPQMTFTLLTKGHGGSLILEFHMPCLYSTSYELHDPNVTKRQFVKQALSRDLDATDIVRVFIKWT